MSIPLATDVEYVTSGGSGGAVVGRDGGKVGFYGATPVTFQTVTQQTTRTTTALRTDLDRIYSALSNLGLISIG